MPEELQRRETRIARIREAKQALEELSPRASHGSEGKNPKESQPAPKAQYNFTDPESRILKGAEGFVQGYNTQIAVEPAFQLIVGQQVTQAANDKRQLVPLVEKIEEQSGTKTTRSCGRQWILRGGGEPEVPEQAEDKKDS